MQYSIITSIFKGCFFFHTSSLSKTNILLYGQLFTVCEHTDCGGLYMHWLHLGDGFSAVIRINEVSSPGFM